MSEPRIDALLGELRTAAPAAPDLLRARVRAIGTPAERHHVRIRLRPAIAVAVTCIVAVSLGGAALEGLRSSAEGPKSSPQGQTASEITQNLKLKRSGVRFGRPPFNGSSQGFESDYRLALDGNNWGATRAVALPPGQRLQRYDVSMRIQVGGREALSARTKKAMREARRLGGYVVAVHYTTPEDGQGDSSLVLRVPIVHVQEAIQRFSALGEIVAQQISLQDIQPQADRLTKSIDTQRSRLAELRAKQRGVGLTFDERVELRNLEGKVMQLLSRRSAVIRQGTYARVALDLTTRKPSEAKPAPGRFDRFLSNSGDILGKEGIIVLYALVVAGPFLLLAILALIGERARRRRSDRRLLEETA